MVTLTWHAYKLYKVHKFHINSTRGTSRLRMYLWWNLCTLYLHAYQVRVTVGDRSLLLYLCYIFQALVNSLLCWFCTSTRPHSVSEFCIQQSVVVSQGSLINTVISCESWFRGLFGAQVSTFMDGKSFFGGCFLLLFFLLLFFFFFSHSQPTRVNQNLWVIIMIDNGWVLYHPCIINIWVSLM